MLSHHMVKVLIGRGYTVFSLSQSLHKETLLFCIFESHIIDRRFQQFMSVACPRVTPQRSVWKGAVRVVG